MPIGRSQMTKQVEGQLRGARDEKKKVRTYSGGGMKNGKTKKIKTVIKGLKKASKLHAGQARTLKGVINGKKTKKSS
tara:strand:- start:427 stop:657 length:231 start_codon:yes stop_codon:yes gene_type:complete